MDETGQLRVHKRAMLAKYTLNMPRMMTMMYPKDAWVAVGLMDIGPGSVVLEAETGLGSTTLHLSRYYGK